MTLNISVSIYLIFHCQWRQWCTFLFCIHETALDMLLFYAFNICLDLPFQYLYYFWKVFFLDIFFSLLLLMCLNGTDFSYVPYVLFFNFWVILDTSNWIIFYFTSPLAVKSIFSVLNSIIIYFLVVDFSFNYF